MLYARVGRGLLYATAVLAGLSSTAIAADLSVAPMYRPLSCSSGRELERELSGHRRRRGLGQRSRTQRYYRRRSNATLQSQWRLPRVYERLQPSEWSPGVRL